MQPALRDPNPPLTRSVEDYLKAIYHLSSQGGFAATSDIAAMLEVAPPSVSGMVKRLSETGLIEHVPYRGVRSEEHTSELQSRLHLVCRLLLEKKKKKMFKKINRQRSRETQKSTVNRVIELKSA